MAMFTREEPGDRSAETVIGPSVKVEGNFVGSGNVVVEGSVTGTIRTSKDLRVGEGAKIKADIEAANVTVAGEVHGNVKANGRLDLGPSAKVFGNVETMSLTVANGAVLNGKCTMVKGEAGLATPPVAEKPEKKRAA
ncbi:MAG: polymer-forming cytoskeletal protein [Candidatus Kerfeldbacteria bacterium]|nr:polymer-forming cytoskeletal protein [Candidatus Kerfeldbacteria bacterium]